MTADVDSFSFMPDCYQPTAILPSEGEVSLTQISCHTKWVSTVSSDSLTIWDTATASVFTMLKFESSIPGSVKWDTNDDDIFFIGLKSGDFSEYNLKVDTRTLHSAY